MCSEDWNSHALPSDHPHRTFVALSTASLLRAGVAGDLAKFASRNTLPLG